MLDEPVTDLATLDAHLSLADELPADRRPDLVYLARLAPSGRRTMAHALEVVASVAGGGKDALHISIDHFPWFALRYQHTQAIRAHLAARYAPATANKTLAALRGVLRECWRLGLMTAEDYQRAVDIEPVRGSVVPAGRELSAGEILALISVCQADQSPAGARDAAIIGLLYAAGLRRSEVVGLLLSDFEPGTGRLIIRGKGSKERTAYLNNGSLDAMEDWIAVRGDFAGALFVPINKGGAMSTGPLAGEAVFNMLVKRGGQAGVSNFSPHDFRRTFVSDLLDAGADIATVSKMAGHSSVLITARYDRRPEEAKAKAARLLHVPYKSRAR